MLLMEFFKCDFRSPSSQWKPPENLCWFKLNDSSDQYLASQKFLGVKRFLWPHRRPVICILTVHIYLLYVSGLQVHGMCNHCLGYSPHMYHSMLLYTLLYIWYVLVFQFCYTTVFGIYCAFVFVRTGEFKPYLHRCFEGVLLEKKTLSGKIHGLNLSYTVIIVLFSPWIFSATTLLLTSLIRVTKPVREYLGYSL